MAVTGTVQHALRSLLRGGHGRILTPRDWAVLGAIALLLAMSFVFESFGLFGLMSMAFGGSRRALTLGLLLEFPPAAGFWAPGFRPPSSSGSFWRG